MSLTIHVPQPETALRRTQAAEFKWGAQHRSLAGSRVDDLVQLDRMVLLCNGCAPKFNVRRNAYRPWSETWLCVSQCDGCKTMTPGVKAFVSESAYPDVGVHETPRRGRWSNWFKRSALLR